MPVKLADVWFLVLLRGLIEAGFAVTFFAPAVQEGGPLNLVVGSLLIAGGLIEFWMTLRLRGHAFRGILFFIATTGVMCGAFLLYHYPATLSLLLVMFGLWLAIRGFGALWLGLSIVSGKFDRLVPVMAGLIGILGGTAIMFSFPVDVQLFVLLLLVYGGTSALLHLVLTWRFWGEQRRRIEEAVSQS